MLNEKDFQQTLIEYLDSLRPKNSKWNGKVACYDCDHSKCMFIGWCDVEPGGATIIFNAYKFNRMLEKWKENRNDRQRNVN